MEKMTTKQTITTLAMLGFGTLLMAVGITRFYEPFRLVTGGVTGFAIVIGDLSARFSLRIPLWLTNVALNIPLFAIGMRTMGKRFLLRTLFATAALSFWLFVVSFFPDFDMDMTLAAVFGGVLNGIGLGLVVRFGATTGGTDLAASVIHTRLRQFSVSRLIFALDSAVIATGLFIFGPMRAMYAMIAVFITSYVIDAMLEGLQFAKAAFIISDHSASIAEGLCTALSRGVTGLYGKGMYTATDKNVLLCVVAKKEILRLKDIVRDIDPNAFVIVADVREVLGEGFQNHT